MKKIEIKKTDKGYEVYQDGQLKSKHDLYAEAWEQERDLVRQDTDQMAVASRVMNYINEHDLYDPYFVDRHNYIEMAQYFIDKSSYDIKQDAQLIRAMERLMSYYDANAEIMMEREPTDLELELYVLQVGLLAEEIRRNMIISKMNKS